MLSLAVRLGEPIESLVPHEHLPEVCAGSSKSDC